MALILHLLPAADAAAATVRYVPPMFTADGFVHCSGDDETMLTVANAFYRDAPGELVVWTLDTDRLTSEVRWEAAAPPDGATVIEGVARFPHVFGPIDVDAVVATRRLRRDDEGRFVGYDAS